MKIISNFIQPGKKTNAIEGQSIQDKARPPIIEGSNKIIILTISICLASLTHLAVSILGSSPKTSLESRTEYNTVRPVETIAKIKIVILVLLIIINSKIKSLEKKPAINGSPHKLKLAVKIILKITGN